MRTRELISATLAAALLVAAGAAGTLVLNSEQVPNQLESAREITTSAVSSQKFDDERTVQASLVVSDPVLLVIRSSGTVTASHCVPGRTIRSGTVVVKVSEQPVVALHTQVPLYRDLKQGLTGRDVTAMQVELARLGYRVAVTGKFSAGTTRAVKAFQKALGVARPDGVLALAQIVWLSVTSIVPSTCDAPLGTTVSAGGTLAKVNGRLSAVRLTTSPTDLVAGARKITVFGITGSLPADRTVTNRKFLDGVAGTADYRVISATKSTDPVTATIALATPFTVIKVPPAAVFALEGTHGCIESGDRALPVTVVGSSLGASLLKIGVAAPGSVDLGSAITADECG